MDQEAVHFGENRNIKNAKIFIQAKNNINNNINEVGIKRVALSDKKSHGKDSFKYFIGYRHEGIAFPPPLRIELPQMNGYAKYFDKNSKLKVLSKKN